MITRSRDDRALGRDVLGPAPARTRRLAIPASTKWRSWRSTVAVAAALSLACAVSGARAELSFGVSGTSDALGQAEPIRSALFPFLFRAGPADAASAGFAGSLTRSVASVRLGDGDGGSGSGGSSTDAGESKDGGGGGGGGFPMWIVGCLLSFAGCTLSNVGVNMQKMAHNRLETGKSVTSDKMWVFGLLSIGIGSVADLVSYSFASMSLLAPLGAMTLVVNLFLAPCFNKENLSRRDVVVTLIILIGTVISVVFGSKEESKYTLNELVDLYSHTLFIVYAVLIGVYILLFMLWLYVLKRREDVYHIELTPGQRALQAFGYPTMAGVFGAHSVLCAKSASEVIKVTIDGDNQFDKPLSYFFVVLLVVMVFFQMKLLNQGLGKADALYIVPVYQVCWVVMNAVVGMTYFREYRTMNAVSAAMFTLGIIITTIGVYLLSKRNIADQEHIQLEEEPEGIPLDGAETKKELSVNGRQDKSIYIGGASDENGDSFGGERDPDVALPFPGSVNGAGAGVTAGAGAGANGTGNGSPGLRGVARRPSLRSGSPGLRSRQSPLQNGYPAPPSSRALAGMGTGQHMTPLTGAADAKATETSPVMVGDGVGTPTAAHLQAGRRRTASFVVGFHVYTVPVQETPTEDVYVEPLDPSLASEAAVHALGGVSPGGNNRGDQDGKEGEGTEGRALGQTQAGAAGADESTGTSAGTVLSSMMRPITSLIGRIQSGIGGGSNSSSSGDGAGLMASEDRGDSPEEVAISVLGGRDPDAANADGSSDTRDSREDAAAALRSSDEVTSSRSRFTGTASAGDDRATSARPAPKKNLPSSSSGSNLRGRLRGDDLVPSTPDDHLDDEDDAT